MNEENNTDNTNASNNTGNANNSDNSIPDEKNTKNTDPKTTQSKRFRKTSRKNKQKKPSLVIAFILSLLLPGLGLIYTKRFHLAYITACVVSFSILLAVLIIEFSPLGLIWYALLLLSVATAAGSMIFSAFFAALSAKITSNQKLTFHAWHKFFIPSFAYLLLLVFSPGYQIIQITDESMSTLVNKNDWILVRKNYSFSENSARGKLVVYPPFPNKDMSLLAIRRIIALPTEQLKLVSGLVYVNNKPLVRIIIKSPTQLNGRQGTLYQERAPVSKNKELSYTIFEEGNSDPYDNTRSYFIPPKHFFVMGDNRDRSLDSRMTEEFGFAPNHMLNLRPLLTVFSSDFARIGTPLK